MLVRVLEIPPCSGNFHHVEGEPTIFMEVDWFRNEAQPAIGMGEPFSQEELEDFVRSKKYFNESKAYLVLAQTGTFTINYSAP